jgi:hypothetical protein
MEIEEREEYQNYKAFYDQKKKSLLEGDDVIHLTYLSPLIDKNDIDLLQKDFSELELRLSSWDDSGVIKNSLQDYSLEIYFLIANPITLEILKSVG